MLKAEEIYTKFQEDWKELGSKLSWGDGGNTSWTNEILGYFRREGRLTYQFKSDDYEYLLDLVWYKGGKEYEDYYGLELALESEWGGSLGEIMDDFYKLTDVKAFLKVMIVGRSEYSTDKMIEIMSKTVKNSKKLPEEEYLVIIFPQTAQGVEREEKIFSGYKINNCGFYQALKPYYSNTKL
ncbi:MAG: hypothetical protein PHO42_05005 [Candidatus Omnitrophica bacterium]|nr:hypothetical protein [Candidatus Omnitrophota bacterium]